jgi:hypothetical protein
MHTLPFENQPLYVVSITGYCQLTARLSSKAKAYQEIGFPSTSGLAVIKGAWQILTPKFPFQL